jgi:CYTH domain-containing protein
MALEIERKFLVDTTRWSPVGAAGIRYRQGYLAVTGECTVRVRTAGDRAFLTVKGATDGITRLEYEYPIPVADAEEMLGRLCALPLIDKTRYRVPAGTLTWEVDVFHGANTGLVLAEIELPSADTPVELPAWVGREVSHDVRYRNANLARRPWPEWRAQG